MHQVQCACDRSHRALSTAPVHRTRRTCAPLSHLVWPLLDHNHRILLESHFLDDQRAGAGEGLGASEGAA